MQSTYFFNSRKTKILGSCFEKIFLSKAWLNLSLIVVLGYITLFVSPTYSQEYTEDEEIQEVPAEHQGQPASWSQVSFSKEDLHNLQIEQIRDLAFHIPGLNILAEAGTSNGSRIYIRGVGQDDSRTIAEPAVSVYLDGVYLGQRAGSLLNLLDLERVEVQKGPNQRSIGRNNVAGSINLFSAKPEDTTFFNIVANYGNYSRNEGRLTGNLRLTENTGVRLSGLIQQRGSLFQLERSNESLGSWQNIVGRIIVDHKTTNGFYFLLGADLSRDRSDNLPANLPADEDQDNNQFTIDIIPTLDAETGEVLPQSLCAEGIVDFDCYSDYENSNYSNNIWINAKGLEGLHNVNLIIGYSKNKNTWSSVIDRDTTSLNAQNSSIISTTIQIDSNYEGATNWSAGISYLREKSDARYTLVNSFTENDIKTESQSAFIKGRQKLFSLLNAQVAVTQNWESKELINAQSYSSLGINPNTLGARSSTTDLSQFSHFLLLEAPIISSGAGIIKDLSLYISNATGFKSGSWSPYCFQSGAECFNSLEEETSSTDEIGMHLELGPMQFDITYFATGYSNQQIDAVSLTSNNLIRLNLDKSKITGLELGFNMSLLEQHLLIHAKAAFMNGSYDSLADSSEDDVESLTMQIAIGTECTDISGNIERERCLLGLNLINVPDFSASFGARYSQPIFNGFNLSFDINASYQTSNYLLTTNAAHSLQGDRFLVNTQLFLTHEKTNWKIGIWIKNLTNSKYINAASGFVERQLEDETIPTSALVYQADPITVGVTFIFGL